VKDPKFVESKEVFRSTKFTVMEEKFELPTGEVVGRAKLGHGGAAVIVPVLKNGKLMLIEQYRYAIQGRLLEFPAGTRDDAEDPFKTAVRELKEEIGGVSDDWTSLGGAYSTPGFTDEILYAYLAKDVSIGETNLEQGELVNPKEMSVAEVEAAIISGELKDMKSIVAFFQAKLSGKLS